MERFSVEGNFVDLEKREIFPAKVHIVEGKIGAVQRVETTAASEYILPGFIDAHVHIESSMMTPVEFARLAVVHGTVATVSDPHEIANVLGIEGVRYMIENGKKVSFHFHFGAPSCVPATPFETAGAVLDAKAIESLFSQDHLGYLSEMMNYPGVLHHDSEVVAKLNVAKKFNLPIDGHAPALMGEMARQYAQAGITTDHECSSLQEALDKIAAGMKILIREGSAAKNYEALWTLIKTHPDKVMFSSDDKHPHDLIKGHINNLVYRSVIEKGLDLFNVLRAACIHPIEHYRLAVGRLREGDSADFIILKDLKNFQVKKTFIKGELVAESGVSNLSRVEPEIVNKFNVSFKNEQDFEVKALGENIRVIEAIDGELITKSRVMKGKNVDGFWVPDPTRDLLKIAVVNRYNPAPCAVGFIYGFGLKRGAIASSVAHDCHNIVAVGADDRTLCQAVNAIIEAKGGIAVVDGDRSALMPLPIAGIMSQKEGREVAKEYEMLDQMAKSLGSPLGAPFMTLSFMALLVIPSLKLGDRGLFDGDKFCFVPLQV